MPYPEEAEGFQVDGPNSFTQFHKRYVCALFCVLVRIYAYLDLLR